MTIVLSCEACGQPGERRWIVSGATKLTGSTMKLPNERRILCDECNRVAVAKAGR